MQAFVKHNVNYFSFPSSDLSLYAQARNLFYTLWLEKWRRRLNSTDVQSFHSADCAALGVSVCESTIQHKTAEHGRFADRRDGKKQVVGYYPTKSSRWWGTTIVACFMNI